MSNFIDDIVQAVDTAVGYVDGATLQQLKTMAASVDPTEIAATAHVLLHGETVMSQHQQAMTSAVNKALTGWRGQAAGAASTAVYKTAVQSRDTAEISSSLASRVEQYAQQVAAARQQIAEIEPVDTSYHAAAAKVGHVASSLFPGLAQAEMAKAGAEQAARTAKAAGVMKQMNSDGESFASSINSPYPDGKSRIDNPDLPNRLSIQPIGGGGGGTGGSSGPSINGGGDGGTSGSGSHGTPAVLVPSGPAGGSGAAGTGGGSHGGTTVPVGTIPLPGGTTTPTGATPGGTGGTGGAVGAPSAPVVGGEPGFGGGAGAAVAAGGVLLGAGGAAASAGLGGRAVSGRSAGFGGGQSGEGEYGRGGAQSGRGGAGLGEAAEGGRGGYGRGVPGTSAGGAAGEGSELRARTLPASAASELSAGEGRAMSPMGQGARRSGEDEQELNKRPDYLVESDDLWGDGRLAAPPVLG